MIKESLNFVCTQEILTVLYSSSFKQEEIINSI